MSFPFSVREEQVASLDPPALTELLLNLLSLEVDLANMSRRHIAGSMNISAPDGGIDCSIEWAPTGGGSVAPLPAWLPKILNGFQVKAGRLAPAGWAKDVLEKSSGSKKAKKVKSEVSRILLQGGAYVGFSGEPLNEQQLRRREAAIRGQLIAAKFPKAAKAAIKIIGAAEIARWVNSHISAIVFVHSRTGSANLANVKTWREWENETDTSLPFVDDMKRAKIRESLQKVLAGPQVCARVAGFSGVGKSRFAMELFREGADTDHFFYSRVAYISSGDNLPDPDGLFNSFVRGGVSGLIVVDDCPLELHNRLEPIVTGKLSKLSLLTLDHDPSSQPRNGHFFNLSPLPYNALRSILLTADPKLGGRQIDIIAEWAEGFPEMVRLLLSAVREGVEVWELGDDELVSKLTAPRKTPLSSRTKECLHGLSALANLPTWEGTTQLDLFAAKICHIGKHLASDALAILESYKLLNRRREHLLMVTPFPLALRLAAKWWELHHVRAQRIFEDPSCADLWPLLAERMLHLCKHDKVRSIVAKLLMSHNPIRREQWLTQRKGMLRVSRFSDEADALLRRVRHTNLVSRLPWFVQAAGPTTYRVSMLNDALAKGDIVVSESNSFIIMVFLIRCTEPAILEVFDTVTATSGPVSILKILFGFHVNGRDLAPFLSFYRNLVLTTTFVVDVLDEEQHWVETAAGLLRRSLRSADAFAGGLISRVVSQLCVNWARQDGGSRAGSDLLSVIFEHDRGTSWFYLRGIVENGTNGVWDGMVGAIVDARLGEVSLFDLYSDEICQYSVGNEARALVLAERCSAGSEAEWNHICLFLLENFDSSENVLARISSARSCRSWIGSNRPLLQNDLSAYQRLLSHNSAVVRRWAEKNVAYCENELGTAPDEDAEGSFY